MYDCIVFFHINLSFVHPALTMLVRDKIAIQSQDSYAMKIRAVRNDVAQRAY